MAIFRNSYTPSDQMYCTVCRRWVAKGIRLHTPDAPIEFGDSYAKVFEPIEAKRPVRDAFVCRDCYQRIFRTQGSTESQTWTAYFRPAAIKEGEMTVRSVTAEGEARNFAVLVLFLLMLGAMRLYCGALEIFSVFAVIAACLTGVSALRAALRLLQGLFSGMDHMRRITLGAKLILLIALTVLLLH